MQTTPIIVEILIVGIQGMVWVMLLALGLFPELKLQLTDDSMFRPAIAVAFLGLSYSLGVILDRLIKLVFANLVPAAPIRYLTRVALGATDRKLFTSSRPQSLESLKRLYEARIKIQLYHPDAMAVIEMIRSRVRIARATAFNAFVTIFAALLYLYLTDGLSLAVKLKLATAVLLGGPVIIALSLMAYGVLDWHYQYRKDQMLAVREATAQPAPKS